jgi:hypothetical protein
MIEDDDIKEHSKLSSDLSDQTQLTLMTSSMAKVKLNVKDFHAPKVGPIITSSMIGNPVSKSSLSILKQSLPA